MIVSVRVSEENGQQIKDYASRNGISVSEMLRSALDRQLEAEWEITDGLTLVREETKYRPRKSATRKKGTR